MSLDLVQQHQVVLECNTTTPVGPAVQAKGFGWSLGSWGGEVAGVAPATTLTNGINQCCNNWYYY